MQESYIARAAVVAIFLWTVTGILIGAVWGLALTDVSDRWSRPVAVMAIVSACAAVVSQIHAGQIRLCAVMRAMGGADKSSADVRALR